MKNVTQLMAAAFASPVRLAGTPAGVPAAEPDVDAEAAGAVVAGAEVAGADVVAAAELVAGADDELDELLLQAVAVSARHATAATDAAADCHLYRRISIGAQASPSGAGCWVLEYGEHCSLSRDRLLLVIENPLIGHVARRAHTPGPEDQGRRQRDARAADGRRSRRSGLSTLGKSAVTLRTR